MVAGVQAPCACRGPPLSRSRHPTRRCRHCSRRAKHADRRRAWGKPPVRVSGSNACEAPNQIAEHECTGDRRQGSCTYRRACGIRDFRLDLFRLVGKSRCPFGRSCCSVGCAIDSTMRRIAHAAYLFRRLVRNSVHRFVRGLRRSFDFRSGRRCRIGISTVRWRVASFGYSCRLP